MLVLSRKRNETIVVDRRIRITVVQVQGGTVRIGIEAPQDVPIYRDEIDRRVRAEEAALAASLGSA